MRQAVNELVMCSLSYGLREQDASGGGHSEVHLDTDEVSLRVSPKILCAGCRQEISESSAIAPVGGHPPRRVVSNPVGVLFEIVTVLDAWGVVLVGAASSEFSWFEGTHWTVVCCASCGLHLGWHFEGESDVSPSSFFGLISKSILEAYE